MDIISEIINIRPQRSIGDIVAQATFEEIHHDEITITDHPVEYGVNVSDHYYKNPSSLIIKCGWSNSGYGSIAGAVQDVLTLGATIGNGGNGYTQTMYQKLLDLQTSGEFIDIQTGKRLYSDMLIKAIHLITNNESENSLPILLICQQVIVVQTQATTLPSASSQSNPAKTASVVTGGNLQLLSGSPSPGGSYNPGVP